MLTTGHMSICIMVIFLYLCFMHKKRRDYHASLYPFSIISGYICDALKLDYAIRYIKACKPLILDMSFDRGPSSWLPLVKLSPSSWKIIKGQSVDRAVRLNLPPLHTQEIWNSMIKTLISYYQYSYVSIIITWPSAKLCLCSFFADICCKQACGFIKIQQLKKKTCPKRFSQLWSLLICYSFWLFRRYHYWFVFGCVQIHSMIRL